VDNAALTKVHKLLALATGTAGGEEARTAAVIAVSLIVQHNLLGPRPESLPPEPMLEEPRDHAELRPIIDHLLGVFLDLAWKERRSANLVTVPLIIDHAIETGDLFRVERERAMGMLANLVNREKKRKVLVSVRGRYGGYRMAQGVRRGRAQQHHG
jgi:hypothetical protein